jgi:hypothetical protein
MNVHALPVLPSPAEAVLEGDGSRAFSGSAWWPARSTTRPLPTEDGLRAGDHEQDSGAGEGGTVPLWRSQGSRWLVTARCGMSASTWRR